MTVQEAQVIDLVGVENLTGKLVLTIVDHLDWEDRDEHLKSLVAKLNCYIAVVETKEILESYPDSRGREVIVDVLHMYSLSDDPVVTSFFVQATKTLSAIGIELRVKQLPRDVAN